MQINRYMSIVPGPEGMGFVLCLLRSFDMGETYERFFHPAVWTTQIRAKQFYDHTLRIQIAKREALKAAGSFALVDFDLSQWRASDEAVSDVSGSVTYYHQRDRAAQPAWYSPLCQNKKP